ncbi:hypothetical protein DKX38_000992 [Salix brachista]|uniref:Uncharacterized protein n=1 Tax=Salix brachista TaxID=2182728 RepID=A0A5N5P3P0_9ROSI|nr:hypothetical protein DKX38_000992 [Salix brachista]
MKLESEIIQSQTCQQMMDESEKDFKKMAERITETTEAMKETYTEFMAEAQATASRVCKTTVPELAKSFEKSVGALQSRFGIPSN